MVITLIGYRGSGKSSVGAALAARLGWSCVDADAVLEERAGRTIREIFASDGEPFFRALECDVLADLLAGDKQVIAAGGGAILNAESRRRMREAGPVVWLKASPELLARRIAGDPTTTERRPNLTSLGTLAEVAEVLEKREPLYRETASLVIETDSLDIAQIVDRILRSIPFSPSGA